ncbi:MAG: FapA family protein [Spirochaetales bacterium]|nr:FapA family protein [Spirochaetales bacterium]
MQSIEATGDLSLVIDERGMEAKATFTRGAGRKWTVDGLLTLMMHKGIVEGYRAAEVKRLFNLITDKPSPYTFAVAKGIEPVQARPESVRWEVPPIPGELLPQAEKALSNAKAPGISIERRQLVKRHRIVKIKPKFSFLKPKEEKQEVTEEEITYDRIQVDPTVERDGYILAGEKLGTVAGRSEGEAGRSVTGELIPADVLADSDFHVGHGASRRLDELFAEYEGFVRIGSNWADVVPFEHHGWELSLSEDRVTCYLSFDPGDPHAAAPTMEQIREEALRIEYDVERLIPDEEITALVDRAVATRSQLVNAPLTTSRDSGFDIFVSEDRLKAILNVSKGTGRGKPLNLRDLGRALKESKITGLNYDQIKEDISAFYRGPATELTGYGLAEGSPAEPGPERTVECSVRFLPAGGTADLKRHLEEVMEKAIDGESNSKFSAEMIEDLGFVEAEQRLVTISAPVPGEPGRDVFGKQIAGKPAPEPPVEAIENVERRGDVFIATKRGLLQRAWHEGAVLIRVLEHYDGEVSVRLSPARMSALISVMPPVGTGRPLAWKQVEKAVADAGIAQDVNVELLHQVHERSVTGATITDLIFSRGNHPTGSSDGEVEMLVEIASGTDVTLRGDGSADFRNQNRITTVAKGDQLARLHKPTTESRDGWDVTGKTLQAEHSASVEIDAGTNVSVMEEEDGARLLIADRAGELLFADNRFEVRPNHTVDGDVDMTTGHVKFPGNVTIKGSVRSGFYVIATGDIEVGEMVEAALLSADGNIVINQGVKGASKAVLRTKQSVGMLFGEHVTILAVGNVQVKNSLVHCNVKTNGKLRMIGDKCAILGGEIRCRSGLETRQLGSGRGARTVVSFGQDFLVADQIEREEKEMEKAKEEITRIDFAMREKEREHRKADLDALHTRKLMMLKLLEKRGLRVFTLRERLEEHQEGEIVVTGTLHPGVVFESHGRSLEVKSEKKNVVITFSPESGRLEERPGAGAGSPSPG